MTSEDATILLVDELAEVSKTAILVPDVQAQLYELSSLQAALESVQDQLTGLRGSDATALFLALRQLVAEGYLERAEDGYVLTKKGREEAARLRDSSPRMARWLRDAAQAAVGTS